MEELTWTGSVGEGSSCPQSGFCDWFFRGLGFAFLKLSDVSVEKELVVQMPGGCPGGSAVHPGTAVLSRAGPWAQRLVGALVLG